MIALLSTVPVTTQLGMIKINLYDVSHAVLSYSPALAQLAGIETRVQNIQTGPPIRLKSIISSKKVNMNNKLIICKLLH